VPLNISRKLCICQLNLCNCIRYKVQNENENGGWIKLFFSSLFIPINLGTDVICDLPRFQTYIT
jgi:hypothetical protein